MDFIQFVKILAYFLLGIIVIYFFAKLIIGTRLLESRVVNINDATEADQFYYLPGYSMTIKANATVIVTRTIDGEIKDHVIQELLLDTKVQIEPDTSQLISLRHYGNWFSSDEIRIVTSKMSLLQNIEATTEDRISQIITQFTSAPSEPLDATAQKQRLQPEAAAQTIVETIEVTKTFKLNPEEIAEGKINLNWTVPFPGNPDKDPLDISLMFKRRNFKSKASIDVAFEGVFTRVKSNQLWELEPTVSNRTPSVSFTCFAPDSANIIKVPIRGSFFIKKQQLPKFSNGILVENYIVKPSEIEGMASIPINILKAFVSIPAQLFQFKILHVRRNVEYEKEMAELRELVELKKKARTTAQTDVEVSDGPSQELFPKLGKLPPLPYVDPNEPLASKSNITVAHLPQFKIPHNWGEKNKQWDPYKNFELKTCVPASAAYLLSSWTSNSNTPIKFLDPKVVVDTLHAVAPNHDISEGCEMLTFLEYWRKIGMDGETIDDYRPFRKQNAVLLKHAVYWFGGCLVGLMLPESMKKSNEWKYSEAMKIEIKSGHAVCVLGYEENLFTVISFGKIIRMDSHFYQEFNDESYIVLSRKNWTTINKNKAPTEPELGFDELKALMKKIYTINI